MQQFCAYAQAENGKAFFVDPFPPTKAHMTESRDAHGLTLHVFEQGGGWHWALTVERTLGAGKSAIAFSGPAFRSEAEGVEWCRSSAVSDVQKGTAGVVT